MAILFLSDLHLCDSRNSAEFERRRLVRLAEFLRNGAFDLVVNLGDTVSREGCLREELKPYRKELFAEYLRWRGALGVPFLECGVFRERPFFESLFGQPMDFVCKWVKEVTVITFAPESSDDHRATEAQWQWLEDALTEAEGMPVVVCSHVPYPGSCSRPETPGVYLDVPEQIRRRLENASDRIFWAGGHFHWDEEPPWEKGGLTAFMGGRFHIDSLPENPTYLRELDLKTLEITTRHPRGV